MGTAERVDEGKTPADPGPAWVGHRPRGAISPPKGVGRPRTHGGGDRGSGQHFVGVSVTRSPGGSWVWGGRCVRSVRAGGWPSDVAQNVAGARS